VCEVRRLAAVRPNWKEQPLRESLTGKRFALVRIG
jgi:hypothetical protein